MITVELFTRSVSELNEVIESQRQDLLEKDLQLIYMSSHIEYLQIQLEKALKGGHVTAGTLIKGVVH